ncbi:hypothetical protein [Amedibacillus sp. YH-ame10]
MEEMVRIEQIEIKGIKNVRSGTVNFNEYGNILKGKFDDLKSVLGIYGQNGSGKTTILEVSKLLKNILIGGKLPEYFDKFINNECEETEISYHFFIQSKNYKQMIIYTFKIALIEGVYQVYAEKIVSKEYADQEKKWKPQITLIECYNQEIVLKKLMNKISKESLIELRVAQDIEKGTSFIFHKRNQKTLLEQLMNKNETDEDRKLVDVLRLLPIYAETSLIIIENDVIGSINLNSFVPINLYLTSDNSLKMGKIPVNLLKPNEMPKDIFKDLEIVIRQIDIVLNSIVPSLNLQIANQKEQLLSDGNEGINFEIVSVRNEKFIPLKYESEGIKRLISVISSMIAAFHNHSICLMIDEFDSGIFEYLLGEIVEIIDESAKGQFVFTSHNLRALEKLSYKSIVVTTTNPNNRYIQLSGIKTNNNTRDFYYTNLLLGGQSEAIYEDTKNYKIKRAFRKAGELYD